MKQIVAIEGEDMDKILWEREKYRQAQLFTLTHGSNSINGWYAVNKLEDIINRLNIFT